MLDDIAVWPVFEQPAGKIASPGVAAMIEHDQLDEGPGFLRIFPLRRALASTQPDDGAADADAFAGLQRDVSHQSVALVEQSEDGNALLHRGDPGIWIAGTSCRPRFGNRAIVCWRRRCGVALAIASAQRHHRPGQSKHERQSGTGARHAASGVHA